MSAPPKFRNYLDFEEANGEVRLFGRRFALTDLMGLCRHLDSLVGEKIAATIAGQHGREASKCVSLEMRNPLSKASEGTGVRLILPYWAGALSALLEKTLDATDAFYNDSDDTLRCRFAVVGLTETK